MENLLNVRRKNHGCGPTGPRKIHYDQESSLEHLEITTHTSARCQPATTITTTTRGKISAKQSFQDSVIFGNQQTALKLQNQIAHKLVDKQTYEFPTYPPNMSLIGHRLPAQTVPLPKLLCAETAAVQTDETSLKSDAPLTQTSNQLSRSKYSK